MENAAIQNEKREKILSLIEKMQNLSNIENLVQDMFDKNITTNLPVELQNTHPTMTECHILQKISDDGSMNGSQLAQSLSMTRGGITKVMAKLVEKKLVSKQRSSSNRKEIYYVLTANGKQIVEVHEVLHEEMQKRIIWALEEFDYTEIRIFENILTKITNLLNDNYDEHL